ncbi:hypothetical protein ABZ896_12230 [Streptomyces sp. NPDC047072]|uniref:hypothetical protein n=1 Tax=Streptomyces sp. NPDC047072 TaxID=3154809 RepID=UPI0033DEAD88
MLLPSSGIRFPMDFLPAVPDDEWNAEQTTRATEVPDQDCTTVDFHIDAPGPREAELRLLALISQHFDDDIRGSFVAATAPVGPGRWTVTILAPIRY